MNLRNVEVVEYSSGDETRIAKMIDTCKVPLVLRPASSLPEEIRSLDLDAFTPAETRNVRLYNYAHDRTTVERVDGQAALARIKDNEAVRAFALPVQPALSRKIFESVALFHCWPARARYGATTAFFLGAGGAYTDAHYDRERNCNIQLALVSSRKVVLFTVDESRNIYKKPFISDSWMNLSKSLNKTAEKFPLLRNARGYEVTIRPGEMLYMPEQCWHCVVYIEPSAAVTHSFFPKRIDYILGLFSGRFYMGFSFGLKLDRMKLFRRFGRKYSASTGLMRGLLRGVELVSMLILGPLCVGYILCFRRSGKGMY